MCPNAKKEILRYSASLVRQGNHRFHTLTMPSDVLAQTCFVSARDEDPKKGFQRVLDKQRAREIAEYIDNGLGTIPGSIVLSAQPGADVQIVHSGKTLQFRKTEKAFLILDGQHRVYGFSLAKTTLRVPVVIYNGLSRRDETRLFIDINTKQLPVPNELLLDIKSLAEYETDVEKILRDIFDLFNQDTASPLLGTMSPSKKSKGKISRVTFNAALKPLVSAFTERGEQEIYEIVSAYLKAFIAESDRINASNVITNSIVFRATMRLFKDVAQRVQDKHGRSYTVANFSEALDPVFGEIKASALTKPGNSQKALYEQFLKGLRSDFAL